MKLDSRLMAIANLVRKDKIFADIGTDHAYLPVYLVENGIINKAIAADLRIGPLENAKLAVDSYNYSDKIELRLSDGLDNFKANEVEEIAVAGMGGLLISSFIASSLDLTSNLDTINKTTVRTIKKFNVFDCTIVCQISAILLFYL